jgi:hypothetical protein
MHRREILFIFGPARGGTTLVGNLLCKWFDVGTGPEGTFVKSAYKVWSKRAPFASSKERIRFAEYLCKSQMLQIIRERYPQGERFSVTSEDILERMQGNNVADGIYAVFKAVSDYQQKSRVGNKNPAYWRYLPLLLKLFPNESKFIFVLRDGRDVALSLKNVPWGGHSPYESAVHWRDMVKAVDEFQKTISKERILTIKYENLLCDPTDTLRQIAAFLGEPNVELLIDNFSKSGQDEIARDNYNKWITEMDSDSVRIYEAVAGEQLAKYGYDQRYPSARMTFRERLRYGLLRYLRFIKLNLYAYGARLPQDRNEWQDSKIRRFFQPGPKK